MNATAPHPGDAASATPSADPLLGLLAAAVTRADDDRAPSRAPLYQRIGDHIVDLVRSGQLAAGTRLPPTRLLSEAVGVHRNTLVRAFAHLESGGWIEATAGRGSFVRATASSLRAASPASAGPDWARLLSRATAGDPASGLGLASGDHGPVAADASALDLASLQPGPTLLPDRDLAESLARALARHGPAALGYAPSQGVLELREALARDLARHGLEVDPDELVVTTGSQQGLDLLARTLLNPGDLVVTEDATYAGALSIFAAAGAEVRTVSGDADGPRIAELEALAAEATATGRPLKALYLVPDARAPLGSPIRATRRAAILTFARETGVPVIEDGYGTDLALDGTPPRLLRALDPDVIHLGTFSKRLAPGLRVGYLVVPPALRATLLAMKHAMDLGTSPLLQLGLADYLDRGLLAPHLAHLRDTLRGRRDALVSALATHLPEGVGVAAPEAGLALWLRLPADADATGFVSELAREGVLVGPLTPSGRRAALRLAFCSEPEPRLAEAARLVGRVLRGRLVRRTGGARIGV